MRLELRPAAFVGESNMYRVRGPDKRQAETPHTPPGPAGAAARNQDTKDDHVSPNNGGPVREFVVIGDTSGDDFGKTGIKSVSFNTVGLHIKETSNCVTKAEAKTLIASGKVTPELAQHLQAALKK